MSSIAIDLQDTPEALQYPFGMLPTPPGGTGEDHAGWRRAAPGSVIAGKCPEIFRHGLSGPRIEGRGAGLAHEELGRSLQISHQRVMGGPEFEGAATDPIGKDGAVRVDALSAVDPGLAVKRQMIGIFSDQHMREHCLGWHAAGALAAIARTRRQSSPANRASNWAWFSIRNPSFTEGNLRADRGRADRARSIIRRPEQQGREFDRVLRRWQNQTPLPRQRPP